MSALVAPFAGLDVGSTLSGAHWRGHTHLTRVVEEEQSHRTGTPRIVLASGVNVTGSDHSVAG